MCLGRGGYAGRQAAPSPAPQGTLPSTASLPLRPALVRGCASGTRPGYFLSTSGVPQVCQPNTPLTFENITVFRATPGSSTFDFNTWTGSHGATYTIQAKNGVLSSTQPGGSVY